MSILFRDTPVTRYVKKAYGFLIDCYVRQVASGAVLESCRDRCEARITLIQGHATLDIELECADHIDLNAIKSLFASAFLPNPSRYRLTIEQEKPEPLDCQGCANREED